MVVADSLDSRLYPLELLADRQALCRGFLANARRVDSDLFEAEATFGDALDKLARGTGNELPRADLASLLGSLRIDQSRYDEARRILEEALEIYEAWDEPENAGRTLLQLGNCAGRSGAAEKAVRIFEQAEARFEGQHSERLKLFALHNTAWWLVEADHSLEALARFWQAQPFYDRVAGDSRIQLRRRWLEGRIHAGLGDLPRALDLLDAVREESARRELAYEHAMVTLELATLHLDRGDL